MTDDRYQPDHGAERRPRASHTRRLRVPSIDVPELRDATGYLLDDRPVRLSGVDVADLRAALAGERPLGFPDVALWNEFQAELATALAESGLDDVAARLGGSSRSFFSSPYTRTHFPKTLADVRTQQNRAPHVAVMPAAERDAHWQAARRTYIEAGFLQRRDKPGKHFWDSRYALGIDPAPCDYDIEIASDKLDAHMRGAAARLRASRLGQVDDLHVSSSTQWRADAVLAEFPRLAAFCERWSARLGRGVDLECFDGSERLRFAARPDWWRLAGIE